MIEITIDSIKTVVPYKSMIIHAAKKIGIYIPHFCYHNKLSIAANCRMCLVEIKGKKKTLPACATEVCDKMVIFTNSNIAKKSQQSVMEFLLLNHPLDCPICDQGGECKLQDLSIGYGGFSSRYSEEKRVVFNKELGELISAKEMNRCIYCTRCIRFGQEIAGVMELGLLGRGNNLEISSFNNRIIESELSGNMIDICPVGALTSKPFRYTSRSWELLNIKSISPHDSIGSNMIMQIKNETIMRVIPLENESINECWISDRDRFSYVGLNKNNRLSNPMIKNRLGQWNNIKWKYVLYLVSKKLNEFSNKFGINKIGFIGNEISTTEEMIILQSLANKFNSENCHFFLRQRNKNWDNYREGIPWLGINISEFSNIDNILVIGSFLRSDHPLIAQRIRQIVKRGTNLNLIDSVSDDPLLKVDNRITISPSNWNNTLYEIIIALKKIKMKKIFDPSNCIKTSKIAENLYYGSNTVILLGNLCVESNHSTNIALNSNLIAKLSLGRFGILTSGGNTIGCYLSSYLGDKFRKIYRNKIFKSLKLYFILNTEPIFDMLDGANSVSFIKKSKFSIALSVFRYSVSNWANIMLPISPFTETSGTFINAEGRPQSFNKILNNKNNSKQTWKILNILENFFSLSVFNYKDTLEISCKICKNIKSKLSNNFNGYTIHIFNIYNLEIVCKLHIFRSDLIVRKSVPLQINIKKKCFYLSINYKTMKIMNMKNNSNMFLISDSLIINFFIIKDELIANGVMYITNGFSTTSFLNSIEDEIIFD